MPRSIELTQISLIPMRDRLRIKLRFEAAVARRRRTQVRRVAIYAAALVGLILLFAVSPARGEITDQDIANLPIHTAGVTAELPAPPSAGTLGLRLGISLAIVFGLIFGVTFLAKKYLPAQMSSSRGGPIQVLATRSVAPRKNLLLVRVQDKTILIGTTPQGLQFLTEVDQGPGGWEDAAAEAGLGQVFAAEGSGG